MQTFQTQIESPKPVAEDEKKIRKDLEDRLKEMKTKYTKFIESEVFEKFDQHIKNLKTLRKQYNRNNVQRHISNDIPIPEAIKETAIHIKSQPKEQWIKLNPTLKCFRLCDRPFLVPNCPAVRTNTKIDEFIDRLMPIIVAIDQDIDMAQCSLKLQIPKMHDGEYTGIDLLEEMMHKIEHFQEEINSTFQVLVSYNSQRAEMITNMMRYGHLEDYRVLVDKFDQNFCLILDKILNESYNSCLLIFNLFQQNQQELLKFVQLNQALTSEMENPCLF